MTMFATSWRVARMFSSSFFCNLLNIDNLKSRSLIFLINRLVLVCRLISLIGGSDYKLIYRHYATLYFVFCVDSSESELGILDLIQVFVETLDKCFENVCELDLIFHFDKVQYILQEMCMGGMVLETNMSEIVARIDEMNKLEKVEAGIAGAPSKAMTAVKEMNISNITQKIKDIKLPELPSLRTMKLN